MNSGDTIIRPNTLSLDEMQQSCVDLLSEALELALAGRISSVGIIVCMNDGIATNMAGKEGLALNIGCDDLKYKIHGAIFIDGNLAKRPPKPSILKVRQ